MDPALTLTVGLAFSLMMAGQATAVPITVVDLDGISLGSLVGDAVLGEFTSRIGASATVGTLETKVFFDGIDCLRRMECLRADHLLRERQPRRRSAIALFATGLGALYVSLRRRRNLRKI